MIPEIIISAAIDQSMKFVHNQFSNYFSNGTLKVKMANKN